MTARRHRQAAESDVGVVETLWLSVDEGAPAGIVDFRGDQISRRRSFNVELQVLRLVGQNMQDMGGVGWGRRFALARRHNSLHPPTELRSPHRSRSPPHPAGGPGPANPK